MKKFSLLGLVLIIGLFASCTPTVGHICTVFEENIVKTATCTENGSKTIVCVECGTEKVETIPALGHNFDTLVTEATCTENGSKKCSRCETTVETDKVPHTKGEFHHGVFEKDTDGSFINTTYYKCSKCNTDPFNTNKPWLIPMEGFEDTSLEYVYNTIYSLKSFEEENSLSYVSLSYTYPCLQYGPLFWDEDENGKESCASILYITNTEVKTVFPSEN